MAPATSPFAWFARPKAKFLADSSEVLFFIHDSEADPGLVIRCYVGSHLSSQTTLSSCRRPTAAASPPWGLYICQVNRFDLAGALTSSASLSISAYAATWPLPVAELDVQEAELWGNSRDAMSKLLPATCRHHWRVERGYVHSNNLIVCGWMCLDRGTAVPEIEINGVRADVRVGLHNDYAERMYWFHPNGRELGFLAQVPAVSGERPDWLSVTRKTKISTRLKNVSIPAFIQYRYFGDAGKLSAPPPENMYRVTGPGATPANYYGLGLSDFHAVCGMARTYGVEPGDRNVRILEWGSGCGRVTRHFPSVFPGNHPVTGIDIDADNVKWSNDNIPGARFEVAPLFPPTPYADGSFDFIFAISVLSHLTEDAMDQWLAEIARLLSPTGLAFLSFNGSTSSYLHLSRAPQRLDALLRGEFFDGIRDKALDAVISSTDYYRLTFMTDDYAHGKFGQFFRLVDVIPSSIAAFQDVAVLKKG